VPHLDQPSDGSPPPSTGQACLRCRPYIFSLRKRLLRLRTLLPILRLPLGHPCLRARGLGIISLRVTVYLYFSIRYISNWHRARLLH